MQETLITETPAEIETIKAEINHYMQQIDLMLERMQRNQAATRVASTQTRAMLKEIRGIRAEMNGG